MNNEARSAKTKERKQKAYELWKDGMAVNDIAVELGVTHQCIAGYLREHDDYVTRPTTRIPQSELIKLFESGKSDLEIARMYNMSQSTISTHRHQLHYDRQTISEQNRRKQYECPEGFYWKWPLTCNLILTKDNRQEVPVHSRDAERVYLGISNKPKRQHCERWIVKLHRSTWK